MLMIVFSGMVSATENVTASGGSAGGGHGPLITVSTTNTEIQDQIVNPENFSSESGSTGALASPSSSAGYQNGVAITRDSDSASSISISRTASVDTVMHAIKIAQNSPTARLCLVDDKLMKELKLLMRELERAEENNDEEAIKEVYEKIRMIKEKISEDEKNCQEGQFERLSIIKITSKVGAVAEPVFSRCPQTEKLEEKKKHYEYMYSLSEEEIADRGYNQGKEEIKNIIGKLEEEIRKSKECEAGIPSSGSAGGGGIAVSTDYVEAKPVFASIERPVAVSEEEEITGYYNVKVSSIMTKEIKTGERIAELKELRNEIDKLIEELIKSKDEIRTDEMSELVEEIIITPNEIKADNVVVSTVNKKVMTRVNKRNIIIMPVKNHVIIQDKNIEIKASELKIKNNVLNVGNSEVKLMASEVAEMINVEPKEVELVEENNRAVYKIKTEERRKLIGLIPVTVRKDITVDAFGAEVLEEKKPWWGFLTIKSTK